jgi:hypothetical protein
MPSTAAHVTVIVERGYQKASSLRTDPIINSFSKVYFIMTCIIVDFIRAGQAFAIIALLCSAVACVILVAYLLVPVLQHIRAVIFVLILLTFTAGE